jgi:predicted DNA binding CopG/RHH family protein
MKRKSNDRISMWVPTEFRNQIKAQAALKGMSIDSYLREIAGEKEEAPKKKRWNFEV